MKRKLLFFISLVLVVTLSIFVVRALDHNTNPEDVISVTKNGGTGASTHELEIRNTNVTLPNNVEQYPLSGYLGIVKLNVEPGYYVSSFEATHSTVTNPLMLGFEAAAEAGGFFRDNPYRADKTEYQFLIPEGTDNSHPVNVSYTLTEKKPIDITYYNYTSNDTSDDAYENPDNYDLANEHSLIEGYKDGDIILPEDCMEKGCAIKFTFANQTDYDEYKNHRITEDPNPWFYADGFIFSDNELPKRTLIADDGTCFENTNNDGYYCYLTVTKQFEEVGNAPLYVGYTKMNLFAPGNAAIKVAVDIDNFFDTLNDKDQITFNANKKESDIEVFYGTRKISLEKLTPREVLSTGANHMGSMLDFDNITGSGYGYNVIYNNLTGKGSINIDSYYQDKLSIELEFTKNSFDVLGGTAKINLDRFAFNSWLIEVDAQGRNCQENNNGNDCASGRYFSIQYRGVPKFMYVTEEEQQNPTTVIDRYFEDDPSNGNDFIVREVGPTTDHIYARNTNFNPHAIALFYDENEEVVLTKDFDLNSEVFFEGFVTKNRFNELFSGINVTDEGGNPATITTDYVKLGRYNMPFIKDIVYFMRNLDGTIMHEIVLISKDEVQEKGIKKVALFLVNGEIDSNNIPELTYGIGEGKVLEIRGEN